MTTTDLRHHVAPVVVRDPGYSDGRVCPAVTRASFFGSAKRQNFAVKVPAVSDPTNDEAIRVRNPPALTGILRSVRPPLPKRLATHQDWRLLTLSAGPRT